MCPTMSMPTHCTLSIRLVSLATVLLATGNSTGAQTQWLSGMPAVGQCIALQDSPHLTLLRQNLSVCQNDPLYLAQLGRLLNQQGNFEEAAGHLERALLLQPGMPEARLSYAISLSALGDHTTALALMDQLLQDNSIPSTLLEPLNRQRASMLEAQRSQAAPVLQSATAIAPPVGWHSRVILGTRVGYDSNLFGAPDLENLTLTFDGQSLELPLSASYLAQGGVYHRLEALLDLQHVGAQGVRWGATVNARTRRSPAFTTAGHTQLDLAIERSVSAGLRGHYLGVSATQLQPQAGSRYSLLGWEAGWSGNWKNPQDSICHARSGTEVQDRRYSTVEVLSGNYIGLSASLQCSFATSLQWGLNLRTGQDTPFDATRPGGVQRLHSLRANTYLPLSSVLPAADAGSRLTSLLARSALAVSYDYALQQDTSKYADYIDSGRSRQLRRQTLRVELLHPAGGSAQWVAGVDWLAQSSTITLFRQQSWGANLGYRMAW